MINQIEAVYKDGMFLPFTKPELSEGQIVSVILKNYDKNDTDKRNTDKKTACQTFSGTCAEIYTFRTESG